MRIEGLIPAVVQDFHTGRVLMLAYVNQESYAYMRERGETCFWSRSRGELWHKGATSGNVQKIKHMAFDCDGDTLLIQVEQRGSGACHSGSFSCFGAETGQFYMLERLWETIIRRQENPEAGSYTNYLLEQGIDKICKKIGEEAAETIVAAKNGEPGPLVAELSDLLYHMLLLMRAGGDAAPRDICGELARRHGK